jgi:hypothetical protein
MLLEYFKTSMGPDKIVNGTGGHGYVPGTVSEQVIAKLRYGSTPPWPAGAAGLGSSLQLIDSHQDNWRVGNWSGASPPSQKSR